MVPFPSRLLHLLRRLHEVVEGPGVVETGPVRVVDRHLDAVEPDVLARPRLERVSADEDAAVAPLADLVVARQDVILPHFLMDHHVAAAPVRVDAAVLDRRLARLLAAGHPPVERLAVEEEEPAVGLFLWAQLVVPGWRDRHDQQQDGDYGPHGNSTTIVRRSASNAEIAAPRQ